MLILDFLPNWKSGLTENHEYLTDIMVAHDMTEQRAALRSKPRCTMQAAYLLHGADASRFDMVLAAGQAQVLLMPYWPAPSHLAAAAANGATTITLDKAPPVWVVPGAFLAMIYAGKSSLAVKVKTVAGKTIELEDTDPVRGKWPTGALVYPTWEVRVPDSIPAKRHTPTVTEVSMTIARQVSGDAEPVAAKTPDMLYNGVEVLTRDINWRDGQDVEMAWLTDLVDGQRGRRTYEVRARAQQRTSGGSVLIKSAEEAEWWQAFFARQMGRRGTFYAPTRARDLPLVASPDPARSAFAIPGTEFYQLMQPGVTMFTHMMIRLQNGNYSLHKISNLEVDFAADVTYIKSTDQWQQPYGPEKGLTKYLASKCRLAADTLTINWRTTNIGEAKISVTTVGENW